MPLFEPAEWSFAEKATDLVKTNPFRPGWMEKSAAHPGRPARDEGDGIRVASGLGTCGGRPSKFPFVRGSTG